ncbi:signal peptidase I [Telmatospirillum sp. J64-1]|uniref:signal peptidase I n=1 Tax=Telmatospirillum sp. J64-1 TaxID=2502183 RepID=UPI00115D353D|nr:signal peptidase I [Telmatospirillum sp. J64-1]
MSGKKPGGVAETVKTIVYAVLIAIFVRTVAFEPFNIPSGSMIPSLLVGDYLFVSKYSYGYSRYSLPFGLPLFEGRIMFTPPERGDVVVFKLPTDSSKDFIKRVVALPGETVQMVGGVLHINGEPVQRRQIEDYVVRGPLGGVERIPQYIETLPNGTEHRILEAHGDRGMMDETRVYHVPEGHYFMMGDNRDNSQDSRYPEVGFVPVDHLVGRAEVLFFSTDRSAALWEVWKWPWAIRWERIFSRIE